MCIPMLSFDRKQQNSVKELSFNKKNKLIIETLSMKQKLAQLRRDTDINI